MARFLGVLLILMGVYLTFKVIFHGGLVFLLLGIALFVSASARWIGRWGYAVGGILLLLAIPTMLFRTLGLMIHLFPLLLVLYGLYLVSRAFK